MLQEKAKKIIADTMYLTIATVSKEGLPWNTPVYTAYDENYTFYWASWKENQHSKNIQNNSDVFIVIYDSHAPEGEGEGVYIKAKAYEVNDPKEIERALVYYCGRKNSTPRKAEEFLGTYPRRIYKAVPENFWMNVDGDAGGNYVDTRIEIKL